MDHGQPRHRARHLLLLLALVLALAAWLQPPFVGAAQKYNQAVAASALIAYAALRVVNSALSTAKEVEVSVPFVGAVQAKPGMVLDPVDETVGRISNTLFLIMTVTALLALTFAPVAKVGAALAAVGFLGLWCSSSVTGLRAVRSAARSAVIAGVVLAVLLPGSFAAGGWLGHFVTSEALLKAQFELSNAVNGTPEPIIVDPAPVVEIPASVVEVPVPAGGRWWRLFGRGTSDLTEPEVTGGEAGSWWWPFRRSDDAPEIETSSRGWFEGMTDAYAKDYLERGESILESSLTILAVYALRLIVLPALILGLVVAVLRGALRSAAVRRP